MVIYINDISSNIDIKSNMSLFVDDTKIFVESNISLQTTLDNNYKWLKTRKLDLCLLNVRFYNINKINYKTKIPSVKVLRI